MSFRYLSRCFLCSVVTIASASVMAQTESTSSPASSTQTGPITMEGCINGGSKSYTFVQTSTGTTFALPSADDKLARYRGKLVQISGMQAPPPAATTLDNLPRFTPNNVRELGECPVKSFGTAQQSGGAATTLPPSSPPAAGSQQSNAPSAATPEYASPGAPNQTPPSVRNNPNESGASGAPSPGTGNPPPTKPPIP